MVLCGTIDLTADESWHIEWARGGWPGNSGTVRESFRISLSSYKNRRENYLTARSEETKQETFCMMSSCSSLIGRFSPLIPRYPYLPWGIHPSGRPFALKPRLTNFPRALQQEQQLSNPAVESPVIETQEEEGVDAPEAVDGVPATQLEEYSASPSSRRKKREEEDDSFEDRFKLRNGREVCSLFFFGGWY